MVEEKIVIQHLQSTAYRIPCPEPESDGTIQWDSTTLVLVEVEAGGCKGIGYTYADATVAYFIEQTLKGFLIGEDAFDIPMLNRKLMRCIRNQGTCGMSMMAVSALDCALWDLKAKLLQVPLFRLLGRAKDSMVLYGSGGFTSYDEKTLCNEFERWASLGISHFKMKVGRDAAQDPVRVRQARNAIGEQAALFVDANGAYTVSQACQLAQEFVHQGVSWFEEPVSSDDPEGLAFIKAHLPAGMYVAAGEYGYHLPYFKHLLSTGSVSVLQADATRCGGFTGFLKAGHLCEAAQLPFSSHCAPALHLQAALALPDFYLAEYFHDHARVEHLLFDGVPKVSNGCVRPDEREPGIGLRFKTADAEPYKIV